MFCFNQFGDCEGALLRPGNVHSAKVVRHSRYITFQIGRGSVANAQREERREVADSKKLFAEILLRIVSTLIW